MVLRPSLTLADIFGPDHAYVPRAHESAAQWLPPLATLDLMTGGQLAVAGPMPVVCSAAFMTPAGSELVALAGLELAANIVPFKAGESLAAAESLDPSLRLVIQHALPGGHPLLQRCWIDHALLVRLNDKSRLAEFVPPEHCPRRDVVDRASFFASPARALPFVIKAVTRQSTGGGFGVQLCNSPDDLRAAELRFQSLDHLVIEEMLEISSAPCLNFVVNPAGAIIYLGHADQILSPEGRHLGNWIEQRSALPNEAVELASSIVRRAACIGYRGIAGIDVALTADGRLLVLDLNFRTNASTAALLLAPAVAAEHGHTVLLSRRFEGSGSAAALAHSVEPFVRARQLLPLALFDPLPGGQAGAAPSILALVAAGTREEARQLARAIEARI